MLEKLLAAKLQTNKHTHTNIFLKVHDVKRRCVNCDSLGRLPHSLVKHMIYYHARSTLALYLIKHDSFYHMANLCLVSTPADVFFQRGSPPFEARAERWLREETVAFFLVVIDRFFFFWETPKSKDGDFILKNLTSISAMKHILYK